MRQIRNRAVGRALICISGIVILWACDAPTRDFASGSEDDGGAEGNGGLEGTAGGGPGPTASGDDHDELDDGISDDDTDDGGVTEDDTSDDDVADDDSSDDDIADDDVAGDDDDVADDDAPDDDSADDDSSDDDAADDDSGGVLCVLSTDCPLDTPVCLAGYCVECTPTAVACGADNWLEQCSAAGQWESTTPCSGDTPVCRESACVECVGGDNRCNAGLPETCDESGSWQPAQPCSGDTPVCLESTGLCGTCEVGDVQCADASTVEVCSDQQVFESTSCVDPTPACHLGACSECAPGSGSNYRCESGDSLLCSGAGEWEVAEVCAGVTPYCIEATGRCGECLVGDVQCGSSTSLETCNESGQFVSGACPSGTPVCHGDVCVECSPGTDGPRCNDGASEECGSDGSWDVVETCAGATPVCVEATGLCGSCSQGDVQCANPTTREVCDAQGAFQASACPSSTPACVLGQCVQCNPNANGGAPVYQCAGNALQVCNNGSWATQTTCSGNQPVCNAAAGSCQCSADTYDCVGQNLMTCAAGSWQLSTACSGNTPVCDETDERCECSTGAEMCADADTAADCVNGQWANTTCQGVDVCWGGDCVACNPDLTPTRDGSTACGTNGVYQQDCVDGAWVNDTATCIPCRRDIVFPDPLFDSWVRSAAGIATGAAIQWNGPILNITSLSVWGGDGPQDAAGMECVTNLETLYMLGNYGDSLANADSLAALPNLRTLTADYLYVSFTNAANGYRALEELGVNGGNYTSGTIAPLGALTGLTWASFPNNPSIASVTTFGAMPNLTYLNVADCNVGDLSPLFGLASLETLNVEGNANLQCGDLASLSGVATIYSDCP